MNESINEYIMKQVSNLRAEEMAEQFSVVTVFADDLCSVHITRMLEHNNVGTQQC